MLRVSLMAGLLGMLVVGIVGCANPLQNGEAITKFDKGQTPLMQTAPEDGTYALYKEFDKTPVGTYVLKKGDALGFKSGGPGQVIVVAGSQEHTMGEQTLIWRIKEK